MFQFLRKKIWLPGAPIKISFLNLKLKKTLDRFKIKFYLNMIKYFRELELKLLTEAKGDRKKNCNSYNLLFSKKLTYSVCNQRHYYGIVTLLDTYMPASNLFAKPIAFNTKYAASVNFPKKLEYKTYYDCYCMVHSPFPNMQITIKKNKDDNIHT